MTQQEMRARKLVSQQTTAAIILQFEMTETVNDPHIYRVRGWLMDELEARDPEAFEAWIDSDEESPRRFYKVA